MAELKSYPVQTIEDVRLAAQLANSKRDIEYHVACGTFQERKILVNDDETKDLHADVFTKPLD